MAIRRESGSAFNGAQYFTQTHNRLTQLNISSWAGEVFCKKQREFLENRWFDGYNGGALGKYRSRKK